MSVLKNGHAPELECMERTAMQNSVITKQLLIIVIQWSFVMLAQFCWLTNNIFTLLTPNTPTPENHQLYATAATKKKRCDETPAHTINVQTVTDGISRRVGGLTRMVKKTPVWYLSIMESLNVTQGKRYWGLLS